MTFNVLQSATVEAGAVCSEAEQQLRLWRGGRAECGCYEQHLQLASVAWQLLLQVLQLQVLI